MKKHKRPARGEIYPTCCQVVKISINQEERDLIAKRVLRGEEDGVSLPEIPIPKYRRNRTKAWNQAQADTRTLVISGLCMHWRCLDCPMPEEPQPRTRPDVCPLHGWVGDLGFERDHRNCVRTKAKTV